VGAGELLLSASTDKSVRLGDQTLTGMAGFPFSATTDAVGTMIAAGADDGVVRLWRTSDRQLLKSFQLP